jgi:hypothetical protein
MTENGIERLSEDLSAIDKMEIIDLPFIKKGKDRIVFWSVKPSGDYVKDCQKGREYASLALHHMQQVDFIPLFTWCIMDMPRKKDYSGIEVGFLEFFAETAVTSSTSNFEAFRKLSN